MREMHSKVEYIVAHGVSSYRKEENSHQRHQSFVFEDEKCRIRPEYQDDLIRFGGYSHLFLATDGELVYCNLYWKILSGKKPGRW